MELCALVFIIHTVIITVLNQTLLFNLYIIKLLWSITKYVGAVFCGFAVTRTLTCAGSHAIQAFIVCIIYFFSIAKIHNFEKFKIKCLSKHYCSFFINFSLLDISREFNLCNFYRNFCHANN